MKELIKQYKEVSDQFVDNLESLMVMGQLRNYCVNVREAKMLPGEQTSALFISFNHTNNKDSWAFIVRICNDGYMDLLNRAVGIVAKTEEEIIEGLRILV